MTNKDTCLGEKVKCYLFDIQFEHTQIISPKSPKKGPLTCLAAGKRQDFSYVHIKFLIYMYITFICIRFPISSEFYEEGWNA